MKKLFSVLLCVVALLTVMTMCAFAKTYYFASEPTESPVVDGVVNEGEYVWASGVYDSRESVDGEFNATIIPGGTVWGGNAWPAEDTAMDLTNVQFFISADEDYVYLAYKGYDLLYAYGPNMVDTDGDGVKDAYGKTGGYGTFYFEINPGLDEKRHYVFGVSSNPAGTETASIINKAGATLATTPVVKASFVDEGTVEGNADVLGQIEIAIPRADLETVAGGSFDKIGFRVMLSQSTFEATFGDKGAPAYCATTWTTHMGGFHEINLFAEAVEEPETDAPETDEPETDAPALDIVPTELEEYGQHTVTLDKKKVVTVDGKINEGEYTYSEGVKRETTVFGADNILATKYHFSYDDTNVYFGAVVEDKSEHVAYVHSCWLYLNSDLNNGWKIYMTKQNGTGVEHWQLVDGAWSTNLWSPIDSQNSEARKNGHGDMTFKFAQSYADGVYMYEISLNREEWGLTDDEILFGLAIQSSDGKDVFGFKNEELLSVSTGFNSDVEVPEYGVYPHVLVLAAPEGSAPETDAPETDAPETDAPETDAPETDAPETDAPETDAPETDAPETDAPETDAPATDAPATDAPATDAPETDAPTDKKGCKGSIAAIGVALVATLGTCAVFAGKKKED